MMNLEETIEHARDTATNKYIEDMLCHADPDDEELDDGDDTYFRKCFDRI